MKTILYLYESKQQFYSQQKLNHFIYSLFIYPISQNARQATNILFFESDFP